MMKDIAYSNHNASQQSLFSRLALRVLDRMHFIEDSTYLKIRYYIKMGRKLNLDRPETFNEKIQWLKLYDRNPQYSVFVDKYEVKRWVSEHIEGCSVIPTIGVWDNFDDIDFDSLPDQFVLKCTHDSGGVVICRDKGLFDREAARSKIQRSLATNYYYHGREWPYKNVSPRIIAEEYLDQRRLPFSDGGCELIDYKFYCFNGEPRFLYVSEGLENHATARMSFLTLDWEFASFKRSDYREFESLPRKPISFERMVEIAKKLSRGIPFVRVDFYDGQEPVFSELTFSPCSGMTLFDPPEADVEIGNLLRLPELDGCKNERIDCE